MNKTLTLLCAFFIVQGYTQTKIDYLKNNRFDLNSSDFVFPQNEFKIIGFGAYHGSAKTEKAEYALLKALVKNKKISYYLPETDFCIGEYFNQYLKTGDTLLLRDLVRNYGARVPQEKSIETYEKWKKIKALNDNLQEENKLTVVGVDLLVTYKYTAKYLLELVNYQNNTSASLQKIVRMVTLDTTDYSPNYNSYSKNVLREFVNDYEKNTTEFNKHISDKFKFDHIVQNLKNTFEDFSFKREQIIYDNYMHLMRLHDFDKKPQFFRFGFFHLEKEREGNNASFFTNLIENAVYKREDIVSVIGYLTESRVLWDVVYDDNQNYKTYTTEGGYGIGDYEKEYFRGIDNLKKAKISDVTLFQLNKSNTPYNDGIPDLIEIVMTDEKSNGEAVKGKSTTRFLDYAVLISNSKANVPIQELD